MRKKKITGTKLKFYFLPVVKTQERVKISFLFYPKKKSFLSLSLSHSSLCSSFFGLSFLSLLSHFLLSNQINVQKQGLPSSIHDKVLYTASAKEPKWIANCQIVKIEKKKTVTKLEKKAIDIWALSDTPTCIN